MKFKILTIAMLGTVISFIGVQAWSNQQSKRPPSLTAKVKFHQVPSAMFMQQNGRSLGPRYSRTQTVVGGGADPVAAAAVYTLSQHHGGVSDGVGFVDQCGEEGKSKVASLVQCFDACEATGLSWLDYTNLPNLPGGCIVEDESWCNFNEWLDETAWNVVWPYDTWRDMCVSY
jgi:hypothetical protein